MPHHGMSSLVFQQDEIKEGLILRCNRCHPLSSHPIINEQITKSRNSFYWLLKTVKWDFYIFS